MLDCGFPTRDHPGSVWGRAGARGPPPGDHRTGLVGHHPARHGTERIAAAFGSRIACVDLVEREVPCVRSVWLQRQRLAEPGIRRTPEGGWVAVDPARDCRCAEGGSTWLAPEDAADHLRTVRHWARRHQAGEAACQRLIEKLEHEAGTVFDSRRRTWPRSVAVHHHTDFVWLWEVGVHPDQVVRIHTGLGLPEPMHAIAYLQIASLRIDLAHLLPYTADRADAVGWHVETLIISIDWHAEGLEVANDALRGGVEMCSHDRQAVTGAHLSRKGLTEGILERCGERLVADMILRDLRDVGSLEVLDPGAVVEGLSNDVTGVISRFSSRMCM